MSSAGSWGAAGGAEGERDGGSGEERARERKNVTGREKGEGEREELERFRSTWVAAPFPDPDLGATRPGSGSTGVTEGVTPLLGTPGAPHFLQGGDGA